MSTRIYAPRDASQVTQRIATDRQVSYLERLLRENDLHDEPFSRLWQLLNSHRDWENGDVNGAPLMLAQASASIDWVKNYAAQRQVPQQPQQPQQQPAEKVFPTPGVYQLDDVIYVVQASKQNPDRVYAKRLVESAPRMTEAGEKVDFEFQYDKGAVWQLSESHRMTLEQARHFMIRYGRCIRCHRELKAEKTMRDAEETGVAVGPVCRKYFAA